LDPRQSAVAINLYSGHHRARIFEPQLAGDTKRAERGLDRAGLVPESDPQGLVRLRDPADLLEEIHMPRAAVKFAIDDAFGWRRKKSTQQSITVAWSERLDLTPRNKRTSAVYEPHPQTV
jgi:hypothetical protein